MVTTNMTLTLAHAIVLLYYQETTTCLYLDHLLPSLQLSGLLIASLSKSNASSYMPTYIHCVQYQLGAAKLVKGQRKLHLPT